MRTEAHLPLDPAKNLHSDDHEVLEVFDANGFRLNSALYDMLNEHHTHRTERRGAGYTQASRHLAEHVNAPRHLYECDEVRLFAAREFGRVRELMGATAAKGLDLTWRNLDLHPLPEGARRDAGLRELHGEEARRQSRLRELPLRVGREESRLIAGLVVDLVLPTTPEAAGCIELPSWPEKLAIGTCPLAEKYFLELAEGFVRRTGSINVIVSEEGSPLLVEKLKLGDDHSCMSVVPLLLNGVRLPPGSLFGVTYADGVGGSPNRELAGQLLPLSQCDGFRFLRLTTLAVSPENRARAFTSHFEAQVQGGLFSPGTTSIDQVARVARRQTAC